jgi:hypothetical protein
MFILSDNGGVHCIQTYCALSEAEQVQIKGTIRDYFSCTLFNLAAVSRLILYCCFAITSFFFFFFFLGPLYCSHTQTLGRVARQGDKGSHEYLLLHSDLVKLFPVVVKSTNDSMFFVVNSLVLYHLMLDSHPDDYSGFEDFKVDSNPSTTAEKNEELILKKVV